MEKEKMKPVGEAGINMELPGSNVPADIFWDLIKNRIWPPDTAWLSHVTALVGSDCTLYETDISEAMLKAGFKSVESRYVKYASGTNRVDIARK